MPEMDLQGSRAVGLSRQLYLSLKQRILSGQLAQGEALPSTRELAKALGVSRNTVCAAYDMLWTEGYIHNHPGAPSRVAPDLMLALPVKPSAPQAAPEATRIRWDFHTGQPDLSLFPWPTWSHLLREATATLSTQALAYGSPKGYEPLCGEITHWLLRSRGMAVAPESVFITSGATQAFHLLVPMLHKPGCAFALEDPSHPGIRATVSDRGFPLLWMPVDGQGADVSALHGRAISAAYVTPSHQFPLGSILPAARRTALVRMAAEQDFYVLEDDYDSEFRYSGASVTPMHTLSPERVVYVGTFSKTLFPALRIGFAVLPPALRERWLRDRMYADVQNPVLEQAALAAFLRARGVDRHLRTMRRAYGEKRQVLLSALHTAFGNDVLALGDASGLHMALRFPGMRFGESFALACREAGVRIDGIGAYAACPQAYADHLLLGYGHLSHAQINEGIAALRACVQSAAGRDRVEK